MSRSHKKEPVCTLGPNRSLFWKRQAGKAVRQHRGTVGDGSAYRRYYPSCNLRDWWWRRTLAEHLAREKELEAIVAGMVGREPEPIDVALETQRWRRMYQKK